MVETYELDSPEAERRREDPHYKLIQKLDHFLHDLIDDPKYKTMADQLHSEVHEAAFQFVTHSGI